MKRFGNLIEHIAHPENLRLAFYKAQKGKQLKPEVVEYRKALDKNLLHLRKQLLSGQVDVGNYHTFTIYEPKERSIVAASFSERVLHHALMHICHPIFERHLIYDTYACRPGKGTYAAIDRACSFSSKYEWFLKLDYRKYFDSIDHAVLKNKLERLFKDKLLLQAFFDIIDSYSVSSGKGLPIGNLSSQYFANYYLSSIDHLVREQLGIPGYVRYMDDIVLWSNSKSQLSEAHELMFSHSQNTLQLVFKPKCMNKTVVGLPFLGYRISSTNMKLGVKSKRRYRTKLNYYVSQYSQGLWTEEELQRHLLPLISFTRYAQALGYRKMILASLGEQALGLEPRESRRQLEQQPEEQPSVQSQQQ
jgi:retron-type reverse transcriptase